MGIDANAQFVESSKNLGVNHIAVTPNLIGGGVVSFDYNNDGWQDLYFTGGTNKDELYKNIDGETFEKVNLPVLSFTARSNTSGVISGDFNNDGCEDLYITTLTKDASLLLINNCDETFELQYIYLEEDNGEYVSSVGAFASDINQDGLLDIYTFNYVRDHHFLMDSTENIIGYDHNCYTNSILINKGNFEFTLLTDSYLKGNQGCTLAGVSSRFIGSSNNGAYLVNDFGEWIYPNQTVDSAGLVGSGLDTPIYGMGIAVADFDNDEDYDLYLTNIGKNKLLRNDNSVFSEVAAEYDVENEFVLDTISAVSWGTIFFDFDNNSFADLFVSNGYVPVADFLSSSIINENKFFRNDINEFTDITDAIGLSSMGINRGCIYTDLNNDGRLDVVVAATADNDLGFNDTKRSKIFINKLSSDNNFVQIYLEGNQTNRNGYNTEVKIYSDSITLSQILLSGTSHASQNISALHFGLGQIENIDSMKVFWTNGIIDKYIDIPKNQQILLREENRELLILGCTDASAENYNELAQKNSGCIYSTATSESQYAHEDMIIFPNPATRQIFLTPPSSIKNQKVNLKIYNTLGEVKYAKQDLLISDSFEIVLDGLSLGSYCLQLIKANKTIVTKKFMIVDY